MSTQKRSRNTSQTTSHPKRAKRAVRPTQEPFPFLNLPLEVQQKILRLCLVSHSPIIIEVDEPSGWDGERLGEAAIYDNDELVKLTTTNLPRKINTSLLRTNSGLRYLAVPILYGENAFGFQGQYPWNDLLYFNQRLASVTQPSQQWIREFGTPSRHGLKIINTYPTLQKLTFRLRDDLMARDMEIVRTIRGSIPARCTLVIAVGRAQAYYEHEGYDYRKVRISSEALRKMQKWGWRISGEWEVVDQDHDLKSERKWMDWLARNESNGVRSGMISWPSGIYGPLIIAD
ncbi:MAG: hypothetical protein Q9170_005839 [Blastenia crenularia]